MRARLFTAFLACALPTAALCEPAELTDVRRELASAVSSHDVNAAAGLIRFPIDGTSITEAVFLRDPLQFKKLFDNGQSWIVHCIASGSSEKQSSPDFSDSPYRVSCSGHNYYFGQFGGRFRLGAYSD